MESTEEDIVRELQVRNGLNLILESSGSPPSRAGPRSSSRPTCAR